MKRKLPRKTYVMTQEMEQTIWQALRLSREYRFEQFIRRKSGKYLYVTSFNLLIAGILLECSYALIICFFLVSVLIYIIFCFLKRRRLQIEMMKRINQLNKNKRKREECTDEPRF